MLVYHLFLSGDVPTSHFPFCGWSIPRRMNLGTSYFPGDHKVKIIELLNKLSTARMEYQSSNHSVYNNFVVPYFIDNCDLRELSHSIALVGSRGSGKSTYIRSFSHATRFDPRRTDVNESEFDCIVLYWKPDTAYCQGLTSDWLGPSALQFFMMHMALSLLDEIFSMLKNSIFHFPDVLTDLNENGNFY